MNYWMFSRSPGKSENIGEFKKNAITRYGKAKENKTLKDNK